MSYETFWRLNPKKLEPFRLKRELEVKEKATTLDELAWSVGSYVLDAIAVFLARGHQEYPKEPRSMNSTENAPRMTDGARFAAFAAEHNKQMRQRKK